METHFGFKRITEENWLEADAGSAMFGGIASDGQVRAFQGEDWVQRFTQPQLNSSVPQAIHKLFEVARGCLIYGYYFYPLYTLGQEQLFRIVEAAVMQKCKIMGAPIGVRSFRNGVEWLIKQGVFDRAEVDRWGAIVELRNLASHPHEQRIIPPNWALSELSNVADDINTLFK